MLSDLYVKFIVLIVVGNNHIIHCRYTIVKINTDIIRAGPSQKIPLSMDPEIFSLFLSLNTHQPTHDGRYAFFVDFQRLRHILIRFRHSDTSRCRHLPLHGHCPWEPSVHSPILRASSCPVCLLYS